MKNMWKKRAVVASVVLLVCAAVYLNWRYTDQVAQSSKVLGESTLVSHGEKVPQAEAQDAAAAESIRTPENAAQDDVQDSAQTSTQADTQEDSYFATARLSRKQARDSAISLLQEAETDENADEATLNEASQALQVLAAYTVAESQIESLVTAKGYQDCVAFMGADSISVVVADEDGLDAADVARIKDIVLNETNYKVEQIKIMEANDQR